MPSATDTLSAGLELPRGRARIELLTPDHAPGLLAAIDDPTLWRYLPTAPPTTPELMSEWLTTALSPGALAASVPFAIIDRSTSVPCGSTRYLEVQPENRSLEIGWTWLSRSAQRTSINTECKYLLLRHAFETLNCIRVQLRTDLRNSQSQAAIARLGATREGVFRKNRVLWDGHQRHTVFFSILDDEWPLVKSRLEERLGLV